VARRALIIVIVAILEIGCRGDFVKHGFKRDPDECRALTAEVVRLDDEIRLRIRHSYEIKWRAEAFGGTGAKLYKQILEENQGINQALSRRAELQNRGRQHFCANPDSDNAAIFMTDNWSSSIRGLECRHAVRAPQFEEGYGVTGGSDSIDGCYITSAPEPVSRVFCEEFISDRARGAADGC